MNVNCSGRGNCTDRVNGFDCDCFPGYTDTICQTDIDECVGINCSGNGRCVDMVNMFLCDCEPGYTDADCETNIDDCVNRNCSGNGVCVDGVNSFSCECVSGFTGETCNTAGKVTPTTSVGECILYAVYIRLHHVCFLCRDEIRWCNTYYSWWSGGGTSGPCADCSHCHSHSDYLQEQAIARVI